MRHEINEKIIKKCAHQLIELKISTPDDSEIWKEISNENGSVCFPEVKKFKYIGSISRNSFDLNAIFPKLEIFTLLGSVNDANCLAKVKNLKELTLSSESIGEHQFEQIFANNGHITKLSLASITTGTLGSVATHLNNLKILKVKRVGKEFFIRPANVDRYFLPSVSYLDVNFYETSELIGDLSFDMPNLRSLKLRGNLVDHRIYEFINHFEKLESVKIDTTCKYDMVKCVEQLTHVNEFATGGFENSRVYFLKILYELSNVNDRLKASKKPTWYHERNGDYFTFKRIP